MSDQYPAKKNSLIRQNGKPVAMMVSAVKYAEMDGLGKQLLQLELEKGLKDIQAGRVSDGKEIMQKLRKKVLDARV